ncbi:ABC transporter substrate-binding protein [Dictyobacter formicarum]|uniref:Sugar ABC transporter substrate-binding protein n=1 Tax=Dictyobacter formicarum TaxID=2778368 RepID=A0ABQ3VRQ4_9CHLR|nr:ABC transporter substrate-binding protein [Dictyobacter formicarum]GHO88401.1 sugar ABC transporter substrate-binding protein [Dictyobacter formicarum]
MSIQHWLRKPRFLLLFLFLLSIILGACGNSTGGPKEVVFWTSITDDIGIKAQRDIADAFNKANPDLHVRVVPEPTTGTGDSTALITSVRGGVGPDVYLIDRFTVGQQAALGLLSDLYPYTSKESQDISKQYVPFAWSETLFQNHPYALPMDTDARALYYNKTVLREAGIDPSILDPKNGPIKLSKLKELAFKVNHKDAQGNYDRVGFIPWSGQAFHTTWALDYGAQFFDNNTCQLTALEPAMLNTFNMYHDWSQALDYQKISTFTATYQPANALPSQNPFYTNHLAFKIDGDWDLASIKQYVPKLDYGVTYMPVPDDRTTPFTWSGGFALAIPTGAHNADGGYRFMRFMAGPDGQRIYTKETSHLPTWKSLLDEKQLFDPGHTFFANILSFSVSRPPLPVGGQISDELGSVQDKVDFNTATPKEALQEFYNRVQPQMQQYCPFKLEGWSNPYK